MITKPNLLTSLAPLMKALQVKTLMRLPGLRLMWSCCLEQRQGIQFDFVAAYLQLHCYFCLVFLAILVVLGMANQSEASLLNVVGLSLQRKHSPSRSGEGGHRRHHECRFQRQPHQQVQALSFSPDARAASWSHMPPACLQAAMAKLVTRCDRAGLWRCVATSKMDPAFRRT